VHIRPCRVCSDLLGDTEKTGRDEESLRRTRGEEALRLAVGEDQGNYTTKVEDKREIEGYKQAVSSAVCTWGGGWRDGVLGGGWGGRLKRKEAGGVVAPRTEEPGRLKTARHDKIGGKKRFMRTVLGGRPDNPNQAKARKEEDLGNVKGKGTEL